MLGKSWQMMKHRCQNDAEINHCSNSMSIKEMSFSEKVHVLKTFVLLSRTRVADGLPDKKKIKQKRL